MLNCAICKTSLSIGDIFIEAAHVLLISEDTIREVRSKERHSYILCLGCFEKMLEAVIKSDRYKVAVPLSGSLDGKS